MGVITDGMREIYRREYDKNPVFTLFLTILIVFFIIFVIAAVVTGGQSVYNVLFPLRENTFMDYYNSIEASSDRPYTYWQVIYPPLVTVLYAILGHFTIPFVDLVPGMELPFALRDSQMGIMSYFLITIMTLLLLLWIFRKLTKGTGLRADLLFMLMLLSFPFIHAIERGNNIILALLFCFIFLMGYRSENKWVRYASYISLGCAAGFKLYPAILWLLTLRDRKYKEAGICALIVMALIFLPFLLTDGNPMILLEAITVHLPIASGSTNISQMVSGVFDWLGLSKGIASLTGQIITGAFMLLSFLIILFDREMKFWKVVALIACNLILGPGVGIPYLLVYMSLPILYFLISEKDASRENIFYIVCFAMTVILIPEVGGTGSIFVIVIAVAILYEGLARMYRRARDKRRSADLPLNAKDRDPASE